MKSNRRAIFTAATNVNQALDDLHDLQQAKAA